MILATGGQTSYKVLAHGTLKPNATKTITAVASGRSGSKLKDDVTATNADGGKPTTPQVAKVG